MDRLATSFIEAFDGLATGQIDGLGVYDFCDPWATTRDADCDAVVEVKSGADKMLRLGDINAAGHVDCDLAIDAGHYIMSGVIEFNMRQTVNNKSSAVGFFDDSVAEAMWLAMADIGQIQFYDGNATNNLQAYAANTWYAIRIHLDTLGGGAIVFVDNVFRLRVSLTNVDFVKKIRVRTIDAATGYNVDIDDLKWTNLTI